MEGRHEAWDVTAHGRVVADGIMAAVGQGQGVAAIVGAQLQTLVSQQPVLEFAIGDPQGLLEGRGRQAGVGDQPLNQRGAVVRAERSGLGLSQGVGVVALGEGQDLLVPGFDGAALAIDLAVVPRGVRHGRQR